MPHKELPWIKNFNANQQHFGLSQEALNANERSLLLSHDHNHVNCPEEHDIYFTIRCSDTSSVVYHPVSSPRPESSDNDHPLSRYSGLWVGTYGSHGLELLHFEFCYQFVCPATVDGERKDDEIVRNALVARKITGDFNVPHSQISFAATHPMKSETDAPVCYDGIGQSKTSKA